MFTGGLGAGGFISSGNWTTDTHGTYFPDPFMDMASLAMPKTINYAMRYCEYLMFAQSTYFRALDRILSYNLPGIEIEGVNDDEERKLITDYLHSPDGIDIINDLHTAAMNFLVYGNVFTSVILPFRRYLMCPRCHLEKPFGAITENPLFKFKWDNFEFKAYCPKCKYSGAWDRIDRSEGNSGKVKIKHWSPHEIELIWDAVSDDVSVIWKIPEDYRQQITNGQKALFQLERCPWEVIQCIKSNTHLRFSRDAVHHMKEPTLAGIRNRGWGISRVLANFRQAWYVQVLHRYNEAIALDYVIPFRLITPAPQASPESKGVLENMNASGFMADVHRMIQQRRVDPASWFSLPYPVEYQVLGGDATKLAPADLMTQAKETLLHDIGVPVELYKGTLQLQSMPSSLRLFESQFANFRHNMNAYLHFVMRKLSQFLSWEAATAKLREITVADDIQREMTKIQLMISGQVSKQTGLAAVGADYFTEVKRQMQEQEFEADQSGKLNKLLMNDAAMEQMSNPPPPQQGQMQGMPSAMPPGGAVGGGAPVSGGMTGMPMTDAAMGTMAGQPTQPAQPTTPQELQQKALIEAQRMMTLPEAQKDSALIQLSKLDPTLHPLVVRELEKMRNKADLMGRSMVLANQFGKSGAMLLRRKKKSVLDQKVFN